jgi:hypothetical protein
MSFRRLGVAGLVVRGDLAREEEGDWLQSSCNGKFEFDPESG